MSIPTDYPTFVRSNLFRCPFHEIFPDGVGPFDEKQNLHLRYRTLGRRWYTGTSTSLRELIRLIFLSSVFDEKGLQKCCLMNLLKNMNIERMIFC